MRVCVILPAAGSGTRFGSDKLGQDLGGRPILLRSVEAFARRDDVGSIVVAGPPREPDFDEFRIRYGAQLGFHGARVIPGGTLERWETVLLALAAVPDECTHVAIHDAARPCVTDALIDRIFAAARLHDAVIPGVAVSATLKRVGEPVVMAAADDLVADSILGDVGRERSRGRRVLETVPRAGIVAIQTPQVFARSLLTDAYAHCQREQLLGGVTDDAQVIERFGREVIVVEGDARNIKVTTPDDLALVRAIHASYAAR
jgi:2-C-methyl-D-erythritol 4-phosphate cytidylyltransferase